MRPRRPAVPSENARVPARPDAHSFDNLLCLETSCGGRCRALDIAPLPPDHRRIRPTYLGSPAHQRSGTRAVRNAWQVDCLYPMARVPIAFPRDRDHTWESFYECLTGLRGKSGFPDAVVTSK